MAEQITYDEALELLRTAYEQEKIKLTAYISTLQVSVSQLTIQLNKLRGDKDNA